MKTFKVILGIPKAAVCFALECVTIPLGIGLEAAGAKKTARKLEVATIKLDKAAGKAVGKIVVVAVLLSLTSCQSCRDFMEGVRQSNPSYSPRN